MRNYPRFPGWMVITRKPDSNVGFVQTSRMFTAGRDGAYEHARLLQSTDAELEVAVVLVIWLDPNTPVDDIRKYFN